MTMISDSAMLSELAAEFPGYEFSTQRTWDGVSLIAVRHPGSARSGLYAVITPDFDEMRQTLLFSEADVFDDSRRLVARASSTCMPVPEGQGRE